MSRTASRFLHSPQSPEIDNYPRDQRRTQRSVSQQPRKKGLSLNEVRLNWDELGDQGFTVIRSRSISPVSWL